MTVATLLLMLVNKRIGIAQKELLSESISAPHFGGILGAARKIIAVTLICETAGAAILCLRFCPELGLGEGIYTAVFLAHRRQYTDRDRHGHRCHYGRHHSDLLEWAATALRDSGAAEAHARQGSQGSKKKR